MGTQGIDLLDRLAIVGLAFGLVLYLGGCAIPRVVILDDPLSAAEHNELGVVYEHKGMFDLAEKEYGKAAAKDKNWAIPRFNLGNLAYRKGDFKGAERHFRAALEREADNADVMNNLANTLADQGRLAEALEMINRALAIKQAPAYLDTYRQIERRLQGH